MAAIETQASKLDLFEGRQIGEDSLREGFLRVNTIQQITRLRFGIFIFAIHNQIHGASARSESWALASDSGPAVDCQSALSLAFYFSKVDLAKSAGQKRACLPIGLLLTTLIGVSRHDHSNR